RSAVNDELVTIEPADHVEVHHRHDAVERNRRMLDEPFRAEQPFFFAAEICKDDRAPRMLSLEDPGELKNGSRARRIVVGTISDRVSRLWIERELCAAPKVIEMRADHDVLSGEMRIAPLKNRDDVLRWLPLSDSSVHIGGRPRHD